MADFNETAAVSFRFRRRWTGFLVACAFGCLPFLYQTKLHRWITRVWLGLEVSTDGGKTWEAVPL